MRRNPKEFGNFILPILCSDILHRSINSKNDIILCVKSKKKWIKKQILLSSH